MSSSSESKSKKEIELETSSTSSSEEEEDNQYEEEEIPEPVKKHPNCCQIAFFQRAPKYIKMGRKGSLHPNEIGMMPSNLNIENTHEKITKCWNEVIQKNPEKPSLLKAIFKMEGKLFIFCTFFVDGHSYHVKYSFDLHLSN